MFKIKTRKFKKSFPFNKNPKEPHNIYEINIIRMKFLIKQGFDLNIDIGDKRSILLPYFNDKNYKMIKFIINHENFTDVNKKVYCGITPIMSLIETHPNPIDLIKTLLDKGANLCEKTWYGDDVYQLTSYKLKNAKCEKEVKKFYEIYELLSEY